MRQYFFIVTSKIRIFRIIKLKNSIFYFKNTLEGASNFDFSRFPYYFFHCISINAIIEIYVKKWNRHR